jgi:hypothetical protein
MKIAVLIAGEYREFPVAHKLWTFLNWENVDCYFSTWKTSKFVLKEGASITEKITEDEIHKFIKPISLDISDLNDPPYNQMCYQGYLINRWKSVISLMNNSGIQYDRVILLRPDIALDYYEDVFKDFIFNIPNDSHDVLYAITGGILHEPFPIDKFRQMSDMLYIGTQHSISKILNIPMEIFNTTEMVDTHRYLAEQFLILYNKIMNLPLQWAIVRSNCRTLSDVDFNSIKEKSKEWWEERFKKFADMGFNIWGEEVYHLKESPTIRSNIPENLTSYNLWNKYDFNLFPERNTSPFWKSPDDLYTYERTREYRKTQYVTYGEYDITYNYNSYGFRSNETGPKEFEEAYEYPTMLVSGCSFTEGIGLPSEHLWHTFLTQRVIIQINKGPIAMFNLGKGGISAISAIRNVYVSIEHMGARPDLVYILLPPVTRKELVFENSDKTAIMTGFLPGNPLTGKFYDGVIDFMQKNLEIRQSYHECYQILLFIKYYLKSKNIPFFFSFWNGDLQTVDYPSELTVNHIPVIMHCIEEFIDPSMKPYKQNKARDCVHPGPNSHYEFAQNAFDKLLEHQEFLEVLKKWKTNGR